MSWSGLPRHLEDKIQPEPNSGCWLWLGALRDARDGYGSAGWKAKSWRTHKLVYTILCHEVPEGQVIDHKCRNRICCNPDHLEIVTQKVNVHRGEGIASKNMKKTHCRRGHPYEGDNLYLWNNQRFCVTCSSLYKRRYETRKRLERDSAFQWEMAGYYT